MRLAALLTATSGLAAALGCGLSDAFASARLEGVVLTWSSDSVLTQGATVPVVITVEDEELHRSHFAVRASDWSNRPYDRYMKGFPNIRRVQKYIKSQALSHDVPVIPNYSLDQALSALIDLVVEKATERVRAQTPGKARAERGAAAADMEASKR